MRILYFILPVLFSGIFFYFYLSQKNQIAADTLAKQVEAQKAHAELLAKQEETRERAKKDAAIQVIKRQEEREKKEAEDNERKETLKKASEDRAFAKQESERLNKQLIKIKEDLGALQLQRDRARNQDKLLKTQVDIIKTSVREAAAKTSIFERAISQFQTADAQARINVEKARADAAAAARGASSGKKS